MKRTIPALITLILLSASVPAQASILDDILQKIIPSVPDVPFISRSDTIQSDNPPASNPYRDDFGVFLYNLMGLNTPGNIQKLTEGMQAQSISAIKVHIIDYDQDFYIVSGKGVTGYNENYDRSYQLTKAQVMKIYDIVQDGDITFSEQIRIQLILNNIL